MTNAVEKSESGSREVVQGKVVSGLGMEEKSNSLINLILLFAVGMIVLMNFFEVRKLRLFMQDSIDRNNSQITGVSSKVEDVRKDLDQLRQKINSAFSQLSR